MAYSYRMGRSTVNSMLVETCKVIWDILATEFVKTPSSVADWKRISHNFWLTWNFPNCVGECIYIDVHIRGLFILNLCTVGAIDGKHIVFQAPKNTGSFYFNYKGTFSIVLLAVCGANYRYDCMIEHLHKFS